MVDVRRSVLEHLQRGLSVPVIRDSIFKLMEELVKVLIYLQVGAVDQPELVNKAFA